ncbi:hypothetical protein Phum_PHUM026760 [Pediculus humanus corporis]|uniref:C2H2-type domain-containing protein n=1 Tax=Pediculus humanus subsp. corporis TaxID=121224 RepID=E0VA45_PEDHC|nr:uncharacterized protein Phum_PHUM026760 [Pediculus humanus corporis]EEB10251.1 hypothetical protein Phum_PHUM026760 [Pediculus humanus corporis]
MEDHVGYSLGEDDIKKEEVDMDIKVSSPAINCNEVSRLQCHVCYKIMGHRSSLYKHLKYVHKIEPAHRLPISCREKDCYQSFTFIDPFRRHLAEQHGFNIVVEKYVFQSMSDFFSWKKVTEQEENLRFIVSTGPRNSKGGKTHYYRCQKNGAYKPEIKKRLQSDDRDSIYNVSTTHCISSMFVFEEPDSVTVEFCRTHYGHDVNQKDGKAKYDPFPNSRTVINESHLNYETIDSFSKLESLLSKNDRTALVTILRENQHLLEETELFYENEQDIILKIPYNILKKLVEEGLDKFDKSDDDDDDDNNYNEQIVTGSAHGFEDGDLSCDESTVEKLDEEVENEDSTILKSLGNGVFLDPTSNKRLKLDFKEKKQYSGGSNETESRRKDTGKNTMLVKEYLNEYDEKVYILEPLKEEETVVQKREKILSQLQGILMLVNSENDTEILDDIQNHLSKYALPE